MKSKELEMNEIKRKEKRESYNTFYNKEILSTLNLLIEDGDIWLSSLQLAEVSGRPHKHVLRDIERDVISIYESLSYTNEKAYAILKKHLNSAKRLTKIGQGLDTMREFIKKMNGVFQESEEYDNFDKDIIESIDVKTKIRKTIGGKYEYYLLNRQVALMCLMRYSPVIRIHVSNLFFKSVDMLKYKGYEVKSTKDIYMSIDEEINNSIETLEEDLKEGEKLSQFNMWHLFFLLLNKIPPVLTKYFMKEFPSFDYMKEMAERFGDFTSPNFIDSDKKGKGGF